VSPHYSGLKPAHHHLRNHTRSAETNSKHAARNTRRLRFNLDPGDSQTRYASDTPRSRYKTTPSYTRFDGLLQEIPGSHRYHGTMRTSQSAQSLQPEYPSIWHLAARKKPGRLAVEPARAT